MAAHRPLLRREPEYLNVRAIVTLEFQKHTSALQLREVEAQFLVAQASFTLRNETKKRLFVCVCALDMLNSEFVRCLRPLDDPSCQHICPIALILVHALRNGLRYGTSLGEVLDHASRSPGLRVQWKHPDLLVLCAIGGKPSRCDLAKPSVTMQLLETIKLMGLVSNILSWVYTQALRLGAARDLAHLPESTEGFGFTTDERRGWG